MAEYIEREALIEWLKRIPLIDLSDGRGLCRVIMEDDFKKAIKKMPKGTIADVAPVVRCKDCKFSHADGHVRTCEGYWFDLSGYSVSVKDDAFCSYGARRDDA